MKYHIYQNKNCEFLCWHDAEKKFDFSKYCEVYNGELNNSKKKDVEILNELFEIFNLNHPKDYHSRSLSVGDVIAIKRKNDTKYYYCDILGWKLISSAII